MEAPQHQPPRFALRFFQAFCHRDCREDIEGDLLERFHQNISSEGVGKARWLFRLEVLLLCRPGIIRNIKPQVPMFDLFRNYLTVALRIFRKEKTFTLINVLGLALAITCSLFIYLWVDDELAVNSFAPDGDRIAYVMHREPESDGSVNTYNSSPYPLWKVLEEKYASIEQAVIVSWGNWMAFEKGNTLMEKAGTDADPEIFDMFDIPFLQGNHALMLTDYHTIAISESFADSYFGPGWRDQNLTGQTLRNEYGESYKLAGIFKDLPAQSTIRFEFVIPFALRVQKYPWLENWGNNGSQLFVKVAKGITFDEATENIGNAIIESRSDNEESRRTIFLQPFERIHLYNRFVQGVQAGGRIEYVRLLSGAAVLILLLASINFMNLSTARSARRAKETGLRKVMGAFRSSLRVQFLSESLVITLLAMVVSLGLVYLLLPQFNTITGKEVDVTLFNMSFIGWLLVFVVVLGILSGLYPAVYLAAQSMISSLKGNHGQGKQNTIFRKTLVVFQFMITLVIITGTITVYRQVSYIQNRDMGMERENLIQSWGHAMKPKEDYNVFRREMLNRPGVEGVTVVNTNMMEIGNSTSDPVWTGKPADVEAEFYVLSTNPDFVPTAGVRMKEGRNFDWSIIADTANVLINEAAQKLMGLEDPVGVDLEMWDTKGQIIGVVHDFNNQSLHKAIEPLIIRYEPSNAWMVLTRAKAGHTAEALASLEEVYYKFNPKREFNYTFVDEMYNQMYRSELMVKDLSFYFTVLAIVISCLGLFSLVAYSVDRRTREIGIRKVLGASVVNILGLLSAEFLLLIIVSLVISVPLSYFVMISWLNGFAEPYRIDISWWLFGLAGSIIVAIAYGIIGGHSIKSALVNPVDSLRSE